MTSPTFSRWFLLPLGSALLLTAGTARAQVAPTMDQMLMMATTQAAIIQDSTLFTPMDALDRLIPLPGSFDAPPESASEDRSDTTGTLQTAQPARQPDNRLPGRPVQPTLLAKGRLPADSGPGAQVAAVGAQLAPLAARPGLPVKARFDLYREDEVRAWSLAGGRIALTTGLLERLNSEAELAFVLARQMTLVELAQPEFMLTRGVVDDRAQASEGQVGAIREQDLDQLAARRIWQAGYDPRAGAEMLRRLSHDRAVVFARGGVERDRSLRRWLLEQNYHASPGTGGPLAFQTR